MCVVALAWNAHPRWKLVLAANRDEFHNRPTAPLAKAGGRIGGRDLRSGGMWLGVSEAGRCAAVVNVAGEDGPDPAKRSRGALVADALAGEKEPADLEAFNPFSLIVIGDGDARLLTNRPASSILPLPYGIYILSNGLVGAPWPRGDLVHRAMRIWCDGPGDNPAALFAILADDRGDQPAFIRNDIYGTRCSTIVGVTSEGSGLITERSFGAGGSPRGEVSLRFSWPA